MQNTDNNKDLNRAREQYKKMTETPVEKLVMTLAVPTIISMLITNIYNLVDTAFVGQLGTSPSGAVGVVFGFMAILQAGGFLFGQGSGSILSRMLGSGRNEEANRVASTGMLYSFIFGVLVMIFSFLFLNPLVRFLGSTETIAPYAKEYIRYILVASPFMTLSFTMNNILRFEGKAKLGTVGLAIGAILNMILDPIFMFVMNMGVSGAGLATAVSQTIGSVILLLMFLTHRSQCRISFSNIDFHFSLLGDIVATGLPSMIRQGLQAAGTVILNLLAAPYGDAAIAAMSIVSRVSFFTFSIGLGIGQGFQPVSSFNYGAGKYSRVRKAYKFGFIVSEIFLTLLAVIVFVFAEPIIGVFRDDPKVIEVGIRALRLMCVSLCFLPLSVMTEMQLQSTGQKVWASVLSAMRSGIIFIPALFVLAYIRGIYGIEEAQPLSNILTCFPSAVFGYSFFRKLPDTDK